MITKTKWRKNETFFCAAQFFDIRETFSDLSWESYQSSDLWVSRWIHQTWHLCMQNHLKPPITEKRRNRAKYLTWNSVRPEFVKKTRMPSSVENLGYIKCYSLSSPRPIKSPSNSIRHNCQKICSWLRRPKTILKIRKRPHFSRWSTILLFTSFSGFYWSQKRD